MKRTKLGLPDFRTVKVIGKGAFGEVRGPPSTSPCARHRRSLTPSTCFLVVGPVGAEEGHGSDLRDEDLDEERDVQEGPGTRFRFAPRSAQSFPPPVV